MQIGDVLDGKYRLTEQLRSGGMGSVYVAERLALGDHVAVKVILPGQNSVVARARFLREAKAAARIRHPNVVQIFDFGEVGPDTPYLVMEFLDGPTLDDELHRVSLFTPARAVELMRPICAAVEAGHRRGVLHRDLKPGNVMLPRMDDGREIVKVLDFGLARFTNEPESVQLTSPGALVGTYAYMAPEQVLGEEITPASDVYSLGILLYEMVTGKLPFHAASSFALMDKIVGGRYRPPEEVQPGLPDAIANAIRTALAREPADRPASPEALAEMLGAASNEDTAELLLAPEPTDARPATIARSAVTGEQTRDTQTTYRALTGTGPETPPQGFHPTRPGDWPDMSCFVRREAELETLKTEYQTAMRGDGRLVVVVGEPGVGKSSLVRTFAAWAREHGACVLSGRFFEYEGSRPAPFQTFLNMVAAPCDSGDRVPDAAAEERVASLFGGTTTRGDLGIGEEGEKWRAFGAIAAEFERRTGDRPLVLVVDDLQWAGRLNLELLVYLRRALASRKTFIAGTARDGDAHRHSGSDLAAWLLGHGDFRACAILSVKPFTTDDVRAWLTEVFGRIRIRSIDVQRLEEATGGNPYYLYEVTRHLVSSGGITRGHEGWECAELDRVTLPETVTNAVRAKLFGLDGRLRKVLEAAAVIGDHFRFETVREATGRDDEELEELLEEAVRLQFLSEDGVSPPDDFRFYSKTIRIVLADEMPARRRRKLHERVVRALETVYEDRLGRIAGALSYHHHAVGHWAEALSWGVKAAEEAIARADSEAAETILNRAREAHDHLRADGLEPDREQSMHLELLRGALVSRLGRPEEAKALLRDAVGKAEALGATASQVDGLLEYAQCFLARGEIEQGLEIAEEAARVAGASGDRPRALSARILAGNALRRLGRTLEAEERFEAILGVLSDREPASLQSLVAQNLAWIRTQRGLFSEGLQLAQRALELARAAKDPIAQQLAYSTLAFVHDESGDRENAIRLHEESLRISRALSFRRREGIDLANIGESCYRLGRYERAKKHFEDALAIFVEIGDRACEGDCRVNLGRTLLADGRLAEALAMLSNGLAMCEATGRLEYTAIALYYIGELYLRREEYGPAARAFERSRDLFVELQWHDAWRSEVGLARVAMAAGDREAARRHAEAAQARVDRARASLPPHADYGRFSEDVADVNRLVRELADEA